MTKYYLVYTGVGTARDGSKYKKTRVVRLGNIKSPRIEKVRKATENRTLVTISYINKYPSSKIPKSRISRTTYRRGGTKISRKGYTRKGFTRSSYIRRVNRTITIGEVANMDSIRITKNPPKGPLKKT